MTRDITYDGIFYSENILWNNINWKYVYKDIKSLRERIFIASKNKDFKKLKNLQRLMISSKSNLLSSIRKITQFNQGKKTSGVDRKIYSTPEQRMELFVQLSNLSFNDWNPKPALRIEIPKPDGRIRPLGIPTITDRILQSVMVNALEPEWEAKFESSSYGFRPSRSVNDAINKIYVTLSKKKRLYVVDADISGCFDNISHDYLKSCISHFPGKHLIYKWLECGVLKDGIFIETEMGTPQGSAISPLLCNITLHGLEKEIGVKVVGDRSLVKGDKAFVRYADDFVILCTTASAAEQSMQNAMVALKKRGLEISEKKSKICELKDGFDFLGFNIRLLPRGRKVPISKVTMLSFKNQILVIKPSLKSIKNIKEKIKTNFIEYNSKSLKLLIDKINPIVRGWAQSKQSWHSTRSFRDLDHYIFNLQIRYAKRKHPNKSFSWIKNKYFIHMKNYGIDNKWVFHDKDCGKYMLQMKWYKFQRYVLVKNDCVPDDPSKRGYWKQRLKLLFDRKNINFTRKFDSNLAERQKHICPVCNQSLYNGEQLHRHHIIPRKLGGSDNPSNLTFIHSPCHYNLHFRNTSKN